MASAARLVELAKMLPSPLKRFLARYPPASIAPVGTAPTWHQENRPDPFNVYKHPVTGRAREPAYSMRRQALLVRMAREHGVEELLPETRKATETKLARRVELGLRTRGTGVGRKVKGHVWERHLISKYVAAAPSVGVLILMMIRAGWRRGERLC